MSSQAAVGRRALLQGRWRTQSSAIVPVDIHPRHEWAGDRGPTGPLDEEALDDVRFLLVHHSVNANTYAAEDVPGLLRGIYGFHTAAEKGWPDVAYNFFVDRHGGIWEGRAGSIDRPVKGDATGGSQGFALLCCFLGDHRTEAPTPEAQDAMVRLLAHLASRYEIPVTDGATATFTSRGSNRHPAGTTVTTPTIAGHRDMSATECPGDAAYALVTGTFRSEVAALVAEASTPPSTTTTVTEPPPTEAPTTPPPTAATAPPTRPSTASTSTVGDEAAATTSRTREPGGTDARGPWPAVGLGGAAVLATAAALLALRRRRAR